jgi:hypothetical protein
VWSTCTYLVICFSNENKIVSDSLFYELNITEKKEQGDMKTDTLSHFMNLFFFIICEIMKLPDFCIGLENRNYIIVKSC